MFDEELLHTLNFLCNLRLFRVDPILIIITNLHIVTILSCSKEEKVDDGQSGRGSFTVYPTSDK